jgi:WD40 repeat protein
LLLLLALPALQQCASTFDNVEESSQWVRSSDVLYFLGISPDGDRLFSVKLDGSKPLRLSSSPIREYILSPDGGSLAILYPDDRCEIVDSESAEVRVLPVRCESADWNPEGEKLLVKGTDGSILLFHKSGERLRSMVAPGAKVGEPRWSREGGVYFFCELLGKSCYSAEDSTGVMRSMGRFESRRQFWNDTIGLQNLHFNQYDSARISWDRMTSPSGRWQAAVRDGSLWIVPTGDGEERVLLEERSFWKSAELGPLGFWNPYWSADERYILGEVDEQIVIVEFTTGRAGVITRGKHPLVWVPGYRPAIAANVDVSYYGQLKSAGY